MNRRDLIKVLGMGAVVEFVPAIQQTKLNIIGWVANDIDPNYLYVQESIQTIKDYLAIPYLGFVPYGQKASEHLNVDELLKY